MKKMKRFFKRNQLFFETIVALAAWALFLWMMFGWVLEVAAFHAFMNIYAG